MTLMQMMLGSGGAPVFTVTGGTVTTATVGGTNYKIHTFTSNSNVTVVGSGSVDVLLVGGGGGGGVLGSGGGGGAVINASLTVTSGSYTVTVGDGGSNGYAWSTCPTKGGNSSVFGIECNGGGPGCSYSMTCLNGSSGAANFGGRCYAQTTYSYNPTVPTLPAGVTGTVYANNLGGTMTGSCCPCNGGGGGGAGGVGGGHTYPVGGDGVQINFNGSSYYWAGGGGGSGYCSQGCGPGGAGGGGGGGSTIAGVCGGASGYNSGSSGTAGSDPANGGSGGTNTGAGGGAGSTGGGAAANAGRGGSGIVMIRYVS